MLRTSTVTFIAFLILVAHSFGQSTSFSYQGHMDDSGSPANGTYDFEFLLFDQLIGGSQVGPTVTANNVEATDGAFSVLLDFGDQFPGDPRWLEIRVRQASVPAANAQLGGFTILVPRQSIASVPYAIRSSSSASSDTAAIAGDSLQLGGVAAAQFVVTSDPRLSDARTPTSGSADYIQNGTTQQASSDFNISGNGTAGGTLSGETVNSTTQYKLGGSRALSNPGSENLFAGVFAGDANTSGFGNSLLGYDAGRENTSGYYNSFLGRRAGRANLDGYENSFFGSDAGAKNISGDTNSYFGSETGYNNISGSSNSFFGAYAGYGSTTGDWNAFFGRGAGYNNTAGADNSYFGNNSGLTIATGSKNTMLGNQADAGAADITNATAIGNRSYVTQSNSLVLGSINGVNGATANSRVGIGTTAPERTFHVKGPGSQEIMVESSDASGRKWTIQASGDSGNGRFEIVDRTAVASRMAILSDGKVGIGSTNPQNRLQVNGALQITGGRSAPTGNAVTLSSETDHDLLQSWANRPLSINGLGNNVGIGTTSPSAQLEVAGNGIFTGDLTVNGALNASLPTGSGSYIQNTTTQQSASNFNISGNGTAGGILSGEKVNATTQYNLAGNRILSSSGDQNLFAGLSSGIANTTGLSNSFFGYDSGRENVQGSSNSFFGASAGSSNENGGANSIFGTVAGNLNTSGSYNSFFGAEAGYSNNGSFNAFFGQHSGFTISTGSKNTMLGYLTGAGLADITNATAIGNRAYVTQNNSLVLGSIAGVNGATDSINVGIGTTAPAALLHIAFPSSQVLIGDPGCGSGLFGGIGFDTTLDCTNYAFLGSSTETMINVPSGGTIYFREGNSTNIRIKPGGILRVDNLGSAGSTSICRNASLEISTCSSSIRYKNNVANYRSGTEILDRLRPVTFNWKESGTLDIGLVAEEVEDIDPLLVTYNAAGQVEGVKYDRIGVVLVNVVKEQQAEIEGQDERIKGLEAEIALLKAALCAEKPGLAFCKR